MSAVNNPILYTQARVLVADDDRLVRHCVADRLAAKGIGVTEAQDGCQAWDLLTSHTFDLALIDLSMPNIDGFTLIQCMRGHPRTRHMPIVVITSSNDRAAIEGAFSVGATSFLVKPITWSLFEHHIEYLLRSAKDASLARANAHQAEAVARAKDAAIARIAARIYRHAAAIATAGSASQQGREQSALDVGAEARSILAVCSEAVPHLKTITEQIVANDCTVLVATIIKAALAQVAGVARENGASVTVSPGPRHTTVRCDEAAVLRAIVNLLRNAIQHSGCSAVALSVELRPDNALAIVVSDAGRGAAPARIAACLRPLDEASIDDALGNCIGLGLTIAKGIASAHGGSLELITAPGHGTTAALILPPEIVEIRYDLADCLSIKVG